MARTLTRIAAGLLSMAVPALAPAQDAGIATLREAPLFENGQPPPMRAQMDADLRQVRSYPEQPPVIPHSVEGYEVTADFNKCLSCHARPHVGQSQAPMVSITHYMDREGQFLATVSPRRYFCTQCHVPQHPDEPAVENTVIDIDTLLSIIARQGTAPAE